MEAELPTKVASPAAQSGIRTSGSHEIDATIHSHPDGPPAPWPQTGSQHPSEAPATSGPTTITRHSRSKNWGPKTVSSLDAELIDTCKPTILLRTPSAGCDCPA